MEWIINNVAEVLYYNISESVNLSDAQKTYMKFQLLSLTDHLLSNNYDKSDNDLIFSDYYANVRYFLKY